MKTDFQEQVQFCLERLTDFNRSDYYMKVYQLKLFFEQLDMLGSMALTYIAAERLRDMYKI